MIKFTQKKLPNGMKLMCMPMKDSLSVTVLVMVHTGSKYEHRRNNGISHFLEHMCFKGTKKRPTAMDISRTLDEMGSQYNAFTSQEFTGYYVKAHPKHIDIIIDVLSDLYQSPVLDPREIEKEKGVIVEEIRMEENLPHKQVQDLFAQAMYGDQPAGWNILGSKDTVRKVTQKHLRTYHTSQYVAGATTILVSGNFNTRTISGKISRAWSGISHTKKIQKKKVIEPQNRPKILVKYKKTDQTQLVLGVRSFAGKNKYSAALRVLDAVLGGGMSSRLFQKLREEMGVGYYVRTIIDEYTDHGYFAISLGADASRVHEVIQALLAECSLLKKEKISDTELSKAKEYLIGNTILSLESSDAMAEFFAFQDITGEEITTPERFIQKIRKVTADDVLKIAREIFTNDRLVFALMGRIRETKQLREMCVFE